MNFIRRNIYALLVLAVLILSTVLWIHEEETRAEAHVQMRENFLWTAAQGNEKASAYLYQRLLPSARKQPDRQLAHDFQRLQLFVKEHAMDPTSLPGKYLIGVERMLEQRARDRMTTKIEELSAQ